MASTLVRAAALWRRRMPRGTSTNDRAGAVSDTPSKGVSVLQVWLEMGALGPLVPGIDEDQFAGSTACVAVANERAEPVAVVPRR